jgi:hypothetical protein
MGFLWWHIAMKQVDPAEILARSSLSKTSVSYSWTGGFSLGNCDVHAVFSGDGEATLQVGDSSTIRIKLPEKRYRHLLNCLSDNKFTEIAVRRRWGAYLFDIGRYEVALKDGNRRTVVYVDEKHYIDRPDSFNRIASTIFAFDKDFGQRLDYGPVGMASVRDIKEIIVAAVLTAIALVVTLIFAIIVRRRKRKRAKFQQ